MEQESQTLVARLVAGSAEPVAGRYLLLRPLPEAGERPQGWLAIDLERRGVVLLEGLPPDDPAAAPARVLELEVAAAAGPGRWTARWLAPEPEVAERSAKQKLPSAEEQALLARLDDADPDERAHAASLLGRRRCRGALDGLIAALADPHPDVRRYAADALGRIGDGRAVAPLAERLTDPDSWVRGWAAAALHRLGESPHRHGWQGPYTVVDDDGEERVFTEG